jgi:hypothetical protein
MVKKIQLAKSGCTVLSNSDVTVCNLPKKVKHASELAEVEGRVRQDKGTGKLNT